ncbi:GIP, partial [Symbiodinium necroappetens]
MLGHFTMCEDEEGFLIQPKELTQFERETLITDLTGCVEVGMQASVTLGETMRNSHNINHQYLDSRAYNLAMNGGMKFVDKKMPSNNAGGYNEQAERGGHWILMCPRASTIWHNSVFKTFYLDYLNKQGLCQRNVWGDWLAAPTENKHVKATPCRLLTSSEQLGSEIDSRQKRGDNRAIPEPLLRCCVADCIKMPSDDLFGLRDEPLLAEELTPEDRKRAEKMVRRGVHPEVIKIALSHQCPDCLETRLADPSPAVSLQQTDVPWKVIVLDNAEFRVGDQVVHFMLIIDEATHCAASSELFRRHIDEGRNATAEEALKAIEQTWVQSFGYPDRIRLDPEGCFRSRLLEDWAAQRGIEIMPNPGEAHHQTGQVESLIGKINSDATTLLHGEEMDPYRAILNVVAAHNTVHRKQGFSPCQWAFGRDFTIDGRLFESEQGLPVLQGQLDPRHAIGKSLNLRVMAEEVYKKSQASQQLS